MHEAGPTPTRPTPHPRRAWFVANATVFVSSFCVMVVELVAGRIISRHLGSSIYTWTSVIGVILGGLALGNYIGGRLADRYPARPTLSLLFVLSSAACLAVTVGNNLVGGVQLLWDLSWPARVAAHVGLVFFVPAALLGTIGPVVARMALGLGRQTGRTLGNVYAWGVVGSIAGTFATGYLLIDIMSTGAIIWSVAGILAAVGILYLPRSPASWAWSAVLIAACVLANGSWVWARSIGESLALREADDPLVLYQDESLYSHIEIRRLSIEEDLRGMYLDKLLHSQVSMSDPSSLQYDYVNIFSALTRRRMPGDHAPRTLTIGGGGYVFPRFLETTWPAGEHDVVEIDPAVTRAAHAAFGLPRDSRIRSHHTDGRVFVNRLAERRAAGEPSPTYDFIYVDAVNDYSVPYQLTTVEFFDKIHALMTGDGTLLVNCIDILDSGRLVGALSRTLREVFSDVAVFTLGNYERLRGDSRLTLVVVASDRSLSWPAATGDGGGVQGVRRLDDGRVAEYESRVGGLVLTDAFAPVETLLAPVVLASSREVAAGQALTEALVRAARGDDAGYIEYCREALRRDPEFPEAHYNLGVALYRGGETGEAIEHWREALRIDRDYAEAHYNLGAALYALGELAAAREHLLVTLRLRPRMPAAHVAIGIIVEASGDLARAAEHFERACRLDPSLVEARMHLSRVRRSGAVAREGAGRTPGS